jgi:hypothetical protein
MSIFADDEESWPPQVRKLFEDNLDLFKRELDWEKFFDEKYEQGDWRARWNRPLNPFSPERNRILDRVEEELQTHRLVGYHYFATTRTLVPTMVLGRMASGISILHARSDR